MVKYRLLGFILYWSYLTVIYVILRCHWIPAYPAACLFPVESFLRCHVRSWVHAAFVYFCLLLSFFSSRGEVGDVWCLPVWNLWAVIWFHFTISSLLLLFCLAWELQHALFVPSGTFSQPSVLECLLLLFTFGGCCKRAKKPPLSPLFFFCLLPFSLCLVFFLPAGPFSWLLF